jgi:glycosyltransferase involved in cell wall biosynthesis
MRRGAIRRRRGIGLVKIAAFYSASPFAGWVQSEGFVDVLKRMHRVIPIGVPPVSKIDRALAEKVNKPIDDCDLIIVSGPEHLRKWITAFYPNWENLKIPKVAWYHESFVRDDYTLDFKDYERMFDFHFFPDRADAEKYKGEWLPLGVDTEMFSPVPRGHKCGSWETGLPKWDAPLEPVERDIDVAFIGLMYPKRAKFVEELKPHLGDIKIDMRSAIQSERGLLPAIAVYDFEGLNIRRSMELLAETYRRIKVFVTFPSLSNVLVAKVLESLACGCKLVAPKQPVELLGCFQYESAYQCAEAIFDARQQIILDDGAGYVQRNHRMELRFEQIFSKVGVCQTS